MNRRTTETLAPRMARIEPFHVMELLARAAELSAAGRDIVRMEVGEPDFETAPAVVEAGVRALRAGHTRYLPAAGLPALREAIARWYAERHGVSVDPSRIVVTPGASGALVVALAMLAGEGSNVLLPDPGYPCNRNFVELVDAEPRAVPVSAAEGYRLAPEAVGERADERTAALLLGSPANPTGAIASRADLETLAASCRDRGIAFIVDEIYHGLHYTPEVTSAVEVADDAFVVNSFSKYFGMTGWRLGWLVVPDGMQPAAEKLVQNLFISASSVAQHAALACFEPGAVAVFEERREAFRERRDYLVPALRDLGFGIPCVPEGAFYVYADVAGFTGDSNALARDMLERVGVAATPGIDFERAAPERHLRFAYTTGLADLERGVDRIGDYLRTLGV